MRPRRPTLREIAEQVRRDAEARPATAPEDVRYGTFDAHGQLYSPTGVPIAEVRRITPSDAGSRAGNVRWGDLLV